MCVYESDIINCKVYTCCVFVFFYIREHDWLNNLAAIRECIAASATTENYLANGLRINCCILYASVDSWTVLVKICMYWASYNMVIWFCKNVVLYKSVLYEVIQNKGFCSKKVSKYQNRVKQNHVIRGWEYYKNIYRSKFILMYFS